MWRHVYENESYMILPWKTISGSYLKQNNGDLVFQTRTILFVDGHVTKMWFFKIMNYLFLNKNFAL